MAIYDPNSISEAMVSAVLASCKTIYPFASGIKSLGDVEIKADETLLTLVDGMSEQAGKKILREAFPDISFVGEETGRTGQSTRFEFWYDPLDGTAPFSIGAPTSTVIAALYDNEQKELVVVVIAEPAYRRIWSAIKGQGCYLRVYDDKDSEIYHGGRMVWSGDFARGTGVFCDFTQGFKRDKGIRQILTDEQALKFTSILAEKTRLLLMGSNGAHQAYVAEGRDKVVGGITTAMGGAWDAAGVLLVTEAGGTAIAYAMTEDGVLKPEDPVDPMSYDILIYGNCESTVDTLDGFLRHSIANVEP